MEAAALSGTAGDARVWDRHGGAVYLDNWASDLDGVLQQRLAEAADRARRACFSACGSDGARQQLRGVDFGCGSGRWLAALAQHCGSVLGIDWSLPLLRSARVECERNFGPECDHRVRLLLRDLAARWPLVQRDQPPPPGQGRVGTATAPTAVGRPENNGHWPSAHIAVCANALLSPHPTARQVIHSSVAHATVPIA
jgi:SAM-dependent methyltransferase